MADNVQTYTTRIFLNSEEAKKRLDELQQKVEELRKKKDEAAKAGDWPTFNNLKKQLDMANNEMRAMQTTAQKVDRVLGSLSTASVKDLQQTIKAINKELSSGAIERGSEEWKFLNEQLKRCRQELREIRDEGMQQQSLWSRIVDTLNKNWGAITQIAGSITGLSMTIRKSTQVYADMEEAMADTRKYTGLTDEAVRDLNEDLKKMDTRTARDKLNELAGAAGRLGETAKKDILDFVDAGNMIQVSLGDDLGEGAIDNVGKLAMAFGEDERMGLRGAMLATGSAINELAQNSSAQAGYLVDFTARVAGFGKQLGLTQAQIMGFGAVMDENLLRDEMAATAFGNMLTKMQTDTEKFARIAGKSVKEFTDLLKNDANAAILAVADSLKRQEPQTMMKMLDDMGLDGSRAVGVLSTLADKIDDVRERQKLATEAYREGTSVQKEYATMNNTVQAEIDKCKKRFQELAIELGERLMPVVKYTISSGSLLMKVLSVITGFVIENRKELLVLAVTLTGLTTAWNLHTIGLKIANIQETISLSLHKAQTVVMGTLKQALMAARIAVAALSGNYVRLNWLMTECNRLNMTNPWLALATVLVTVGIAVWGATKAWKAHRDELRNNLQEMKNMQAQQKLQKDMSKDVAESTARERTRVEQLSRVIHSNAYTIDERRKAIKAMQRIIPDYHASISNEGKLYDENSTAIKQYIQNLNDAAMAEAIYTKKVEINGKKLELQRRQQRIEGSLKAVQAYRDTQQQTQTTEWVDQDGRTHTSTSRTASALESDRQQRIHEQRLKDVKSEQQVLEAEDRFLDKTLEKNRKLNELYAKKVTTDSSSTTPTSTVTTPYKSAADEKKEERERRKREAAERKEQAERDRQQREAAKKRKAQTEAELADLTLSYSQGNIDYRTFLKERQRIQLEGIRQRKAIFEQGSAEYLKLEAQEKAMLINGDEEQRRMTLQELERNHQLTRAVLQAQYNDTRSDLYQNQQALNEALHQEDILYLQEKAELYRKGSLERMQTEWEIEDREEQHKLEKQQEYMERLQQFREETGRMNYDKLQQVEMDGAKAFYGALVAQGQMTQEEYDAIIDHIRRKFAEMKAEQAENGDVQANASKALDTAKKNAGVKQYGAGSDAATGLFGISQAVSQQQTINEQLKALYGEDYENNREYQEAKRQLDTETMQQIVAGAQAAYSSISSLMSAASSYAQACSDLEVARITKNYDKQIEAAGNNSAKRKKLEEKRDAEIAKAKTKANKKAMAMELAQAVAQTAMGAISAYSSTMAGAPYPANLVLAPISAGIALAAGTLQIATIKKQHEAEAAGYYEGGFTGGNRYRREAGVVHEGEFVANHQAVNNPAIMPFLNFLDQAQRNNTVGSLTAADVSRSMGAGGTAQIVAPVVNVQTDNTELHDTLQQVRDTQDRLATQLEEGLGVDVPIDGENGLYRRMKRYENLLKNK